MTILITPLVPVHGAVGVVACWRRSSSAGMRCGWLVPGRVAAWAC